MKYQLLLIFVLPLTVYCQDSNLGNWLIFLGNKKLDTKINWHHEIQYRNYNAIGDLEQLLIRTGIGYDITDNSNLLGGYGFIRSENYNADNTKNIVNEHRIFQQLITQQSLGKVRLQHRYRFEQRFIEDDFRLRFRYFLGINIPFWSSANSPQEFYLSIYDEIFLNTEGQAFDRNRLYSGFGYKVSDKLRFELGYMNQFLNGGNRDQVNLIAFLNW